VRMVTKAVQRRHVAVGNQPDIPARTAVTTVGTTLGHVRLSAKRNGAGAPVASLDVKLCFVYEPGH